MKHEDVDSLEPKTKPAGDVNQGAADGTAGTKEASGSFFADYGNDSE